MDRKQKGELFYIDDHATLYGLLCKNAEELCGEKGLLAAKEATALYGKERGLRMAMRCLSDGEPLTPRNYLAYGEWMDTKKWSETKVVSIAPEYRFDMIRCGWNESWKKRGLEKYGMIYCSCVDWNLAYGFNPEIVLEMDMFLSHGHEKCNFHWVGTNFADEGDMKANAARQPQMAERTVKDFLYHTGHLLSAMKRGFYYELGLVTGRLIADRALKEYAAIFGSDKMDYILSEAELDFLRID